MYKKKMPTAAEIAAVLSNRDEVWIDAVGVHAADPGSAVNVTISEARDSTGKVASEFEVIVKNGTKTCNLLAARTRKVAAKQAGEAAVEMLTKTVIQ